MLQSRFRTFAGLALAMAIPLAAPAPAGAGEPGKAPAAIPAPPVATYADVADLADSAKLVARATIRGVTRIPDARAAGLLPGTGRFLVKARTVALLSGDAVLGESLRYLVDLPLDARGKPPALKKRDVFVFARLVPARADELQLVARDAQLPWDPVTEARLRAILSELATPGSPGRVNGVREIIHVPGTLAGEGETQIFFTTWDNSAASATVRHVPGQPPAWGVSFSELLAYVGNPPRAGSLAWYRLACFLPNTVPRGANHSEDPASRQQAENDYRMLLGELGPCVRSRK